LYKNVLSWRLKAAGEETQRSGGGSLFHAREQFKWHCQRNVTDGRTDGQTDRFAISTSTCPLQVDTIFSLFVLSRVRRRSFQLWKRLCKHESESWFNGSELLFRGVLLRFMVTSDYWFVLVDCDFNDLFCLYSYSVLYACFSALYGERWNGCQANRKISGWSHVCLA